MALVSFQSLAALTDFMQFLVQFQHFITFLATRLNLISSQGIGHSRYQKLIIAAVIVAQIAAVHSYMVEKLSMQAGLLVAEVIVL